MRGLLVCMVVVMLVSCCSDDVVVSNAISDKEQTDDYSQNLTFFGTNACVFDRIIFEYPADYPAPNIDNSIIIEKPTAWGGYFYRYPKIEITIEEYTVVEWKENRNERFEGLIIPIFKDVVLGKCDAVEVILDWKYDYGRYHYGIPIDKSIVCMDIAFDDNDSNHVKIVREFVDSLRYR